MTATTARLVPADLIDDDPSGILRKDIALQGLTSQQELFCKLIFTGVQRPDAYRQAYDCANADPQTVSHMAHLAAKNPKVQARLSQLQARWEQRASLDALIRRDEIARGIAEIAFGPDKAPVRLKAFDMLARMAGIDLYKRADGAVETKLDQLTIAEIEEKLANRLAALRVVSQ